MVLINIISVSKPILKKGIPEGYHIAGICGQSCLNYMCKKLSEGDITIGELLKIRECRDQMKRLCSAASSDKASNVCYNSVETDVTKRLEEWEAYENRSKLLSHLCHHLHSVDLSIQGNDIY